MFRRFAIASAAKQSIIYRLPLAARRRRLAARQKQGKQRLLAMTRVVIFMAEKEKAGGDISVATNRKALHDYHVQETYEAGLVLDGPEVKSLRLRQARLEGSFVRIENDEAFLYNMHISPYSYTHHYSGDPLRTRKLLLKPSEIRRLETDSRIKGNALIPLEIYFRRGWAKIKLAVARGKKAPDKRESIKRRDLNRELERNSRFKI
jgi:SsrA-binding protein